MSTARDALNALVARVPRGMMLGLDRVERALAKLGDPHLELPVVHVAGSNGKGSTCAMIERVLRDTGLRTGLYTSPHLSRFAERIRVDGEPIADAPFARALGVVLDRTDPDLTFFEILTVAAFVAFREAKVEVAVLEVGLGGRLDATNVVKHPLATAITSISLEHTAILGSTLDAIAREKAGILKKGAPLVLGPLPQEADRAIRDVANTVGAGPILTVRPRGSRGGERGDIEVAHERGKSSLDGLSLRLTLEGAHQASNAGVALGLARCLAPHFPDRPLLGVAPHALERASWPGRLERITRGDVTIVLDGAHNLEGVAALAGAIASPREKTALVFGALADKPARDMLRALAPLAARRYFTAPKGRTPAPLAELTGVAPGVFLAEPVNALRRAMGESAAGDTIVVAGSLYLVGELRAWLFGIEPDPIIAL